MTFFFFIVQQTHTFKNLIYNLTKGKNFDGLRGIDIKT